MKDKKKLTFAAVVFMFLGILLRDWFFISLSITGLSILKPDGPWDMILLAFIAIIIIARLTMPTKVQKLQRS